MSKASTNQYSLYCREHLAEFNYELMDEASRVLTSWPGRTAAVLLVISSIITFQEAYSTENRYATYTLFTYVIPIALVFLYPIGTLLVSGITRYSVIIIDALCLTGLLGFCVTLHLLIEGMDMTRNHEELFRPIQGQIAFVLALASAFSFHASFNITLIRNVIFALISGTYIFFLDKEFFFDNRLSLTEGLFLGVIISWVFYEGARTRFYLRSTDADTRQHLYNQLSKLVYPHQLERIKLGDELENTMPLKEGKAIINVFDVQRSSEIRHERTQEFFMGLFQTFLYICMQGYEHNPLRSRAFRLKETGDGFISSIGYPFLPVESRSLADSAVSTALEMFEAFNKEVKKFNYSRPIKAAMGLAYNSVQGTFQSGGIRSYDLFGDALIQASKYEELRKQLIIWETIKDQATKQGLEHFNILIVQEVVYNSLSSEFRDLFNEIDLSDEYFKSANFQLMYDNDARYVYFYLLP